MKETINKMKKQLMEWEKIFAGDLFVTGLISKICKELIELNTENPNNLIKMGRVLNRYFSEVDL